MLTTSTNECQFCAIVFAHAGLARYTRYTRGMAQSAVNCTRGRMGLSLRMDEAHFPSLSRWSNLRAPLTQFVIFSWYSIAKEYLQRLCISCFTAIVNPLKAHIWCFRFHTCVPNIVTWPSQTNRPPSTDYWFRSLSTIRAVVFTWSRGVPTITQLGGWEGERCTTHTQVGWPVTWPADSVHCSPGWPHSLVWHTQSNCWGNTRRLPISRAVWRWK